MTTSEAKAEMDRLAKEYRLLLLAGPIWGPWYLLSQEELDKITTATRYRLEAAEHRYHRLAALSQK